MTQYKFLVLDTETTGLYLPSMPSNHPDQPRILSVGAILANDLGEEVERFHAIVRPDGWEIPADSIAIHGITMERAMDEGHPADEVLHQLYTMMGRARIRTGFNEPFDRRMVRIDTYRHGRGVLSEYGHGCELISDGEGMKQERTEWHRVVFFGSLAKIAGEYLKKGRPVYVEGRIQTRKWQGQDGQDRYTTEIVANEMKMLGGRGESGGEAAFEPRTAPEGMPSSTARAPQGGSARTASPPKSEADNSFDDDIPF